MSRNPHRVYSGARAAKATTTEFADFLSALETSSLARPRSDTDVTLRMALQQVAHFFDADRCLLYDIRCGDCASGDVEHAQTRSSQLRRDLPQLLPWTLSEVVERGR